MERNLKYLQRHNRTHACDILIAVIVFHPQSHGQLKVETRNLQHHLSIDINYIDDESDVDIFVEGAGKAVIVRHIEIQEILLLPMIQVFRVSLTGTEGNIIYTPTQNLFGGLYLQVFLRLSRQAHCLVAMRKTNKSLVSRTQQRVVGSGIGPGASNFSITFPTRT